MHFADVTVIGILRDGLEYLRRNPEDLAILLDDYACQWPLFGAVGEAPGRYINQIVQFLTDNDQPLMKVFQAFHLPNPPNYAVFVFSSASETHKVAGDYGASVRQLRTPTVYTKANAQDVTESAGNTLIRFSRTDLCADRVWKLQVAVNKLLPGQSYPVVTVVDDETKYVTVEVAGVVPTVNGLQVLQDWEFRSSASGWDVTYGNSGDTVTVRCYVRTAGDIELHRIFTTIIRWCLKRGRQYLEFQNIQSSTIQQSEPSPADPTGGEGFVSTFTVTGIAQDVWVAKRTRIPEKITMSLAAVAEDGTTVVVGDL
jgi:hypothetical protein